VSLHLDRWAGYGLFAFIPLVLWLLVAHPEPIGGALGLALGLMIGHRFFAIPYRDRVKARKCLWCNRMPLPVENVPVSLRTRAGDVVEARTCPQHEVSLRRFFGFLVRFRAPLALGIFVPLLTLVGALAAGALGWTVPLGRFVAFFQLTIGLTVSLAAWGYLWQPAAAALGPVAFPVHNFFLLGVRSLVWIFRIVGAVWVARGAGLLT
jgi:hypothetical protein